MLQMGSRWMGSRWMGSRWMGSRWTPSGPNEIGIDGYIELFDPNSPQALGVTLAVQSKVVISDSDAGIRTIETRYGVDLHVHGATRSTPSDNPSEVDADLM